MPNKYSIACPLCSSERVEEFYWQRNIPVHVNVICNTPEEAINCRKGTISLAVCHNCGLVFNSQFSSKLLEYDKNYDNEQFHSNYYQEYVNSIVKILINRYQVSNKRILEVGSGNGKFLCLLCRESDSKGIGIDPAYQGEKEQGNVSFIRDYFSEKYSNVKADILILRHVLEHVERPGDFLAYIIHNVDIDTELITATEVPDFEWILKQGSYWDITYEHCNYFARESLQNLLALSQIQVNDVFNTFSNQYIIAIGKFSPKNPPDMKLIAQTYPRKKIIDGFMSNISNIEKQKNRINSIINGLKGPFTIWGVAGKGVTFINTLDEKARREIPFVIDINKNKQGKYCPGTGHKIVPPEVLKQEKSLKDIMVMNPNYYDEISQLLGTYDREFNLIAV